jgi:hypothetical protein
MAGQWQTVNAQPGVTFNAGLMLLLTDGCVLSQDIGTRSWWKLTPDAEGQYLNGVWSQVANAPFAPRWFASAVLRDGRVFIAGGEYSGDIDTDLNTAALYDPVADAWSMVTGQISWTSIGDAPCCVLNDGTVLVGSIDRQDCAIFDPGTGSWTTAASKQNANSNEETWTLLPDGTVLTIECKGADAGIPSERWTERYLPGAQDKWILCGQTVKDLVESSSFEIGPALLLPNGRCFCVGATANTAIYVPPANIEDPGKWIDGPTLPQNDGKQLGAKDAPACLLPNGKVLLALGPVNGQKDDYLPPTSFYEYDPNAASDQFTLLPDPGDSNIAPFNWFMLLLPTGDVMLSNGMGQIKLYQPEGGSLDAGKPKIDGVPTRENSDKTTYNVIRRGGVIYSPGHPLQWTLTSCELWR